MEIIENIIGRLKYGKKPWDLFRLVYNNLEYMLEKADSNTNIFQMKDGITLKKLNYSWVLVFIDGSTFTLDDYMSDLLFIKYREVFKGNSKLNTQKEWRNFLIGDLCKNGFTFIMKEGKLTI